MKERKLALLLCFFVFLGGVTSTLSKAAMEVIPPFSYLAIRYSFAALILICVRSKHLRKAFHKTDCKVILQVGFFFTIGFIFYNLAVAYTTVTNACFYYSISVLILPFLARIFNGTKFNSKIFVGIFITMVGMYFMMKTEEGLTLNTGDIFALCSAFFFALHVVFMSKYVLESDPVVITEGQFLLLSFISAIIALGIEPLEPVATAEISIWINIIFSAMVGSVGLYLAQAYAQTGVNGITVGLIYALMPIFTMISACVMLGEELTLHGKAGALLVVLGIIIAGRLNTYSMEIEQ